MSTEGGESIGFKLAATRSPDFQTRIEASQHYFDQAPATAKLIPDARNVISYYDKRIVLPILPEQAVQLRELSMGLLAIYNDKKEMIGVVDLPQKFFTALDEEAIGGKKGASPFFIPEYTDFSQAHTDKRDKTRLQQLFKSRDIELDDTSLDQGIQFLRDYEKHGDRLAELLYGGDYDNVNYKSVQFKPTFRTWQYLHHLQDKYKDQPDRLNQQTHTFE